MQKVIPVLYLAGALTAFASGPISGTFTIDGSVAVTAAQITWTSNTDISQQATISSLGLSGSFVGMDNQIVGINNLTDSPTNQPVGVSFTNFDFIDFPVASGLPSLMANFISPGSGNGADCSTNSALAVAGQTCTLGGATIPAEPGGSPFTFLNTLNGADACCNSSATWDVSGVTSDGLSTWSGIFTSDFTAPANDPNAADGSFQAVLNKFATTGTVSDAFAGAMTVSIKQIESVPEPTTLALMGGGLILVSLWTRRMRKRRG